MCKIKKITDLSKYLVEEFHVTDIENGKFRIFRYNYYLENSVHWFFSGYDDDIHMTKTESKYYENWYKNHKRKEKINRLLK